MPTKARLHGADERPASLPQWRPNRMLQGLKYRLQRFQVSGASPWGVAVVAARLATRALSFARQRSADVHPNDRYGKRKRRILITSARITRFAAGEHALGIEGDADGETEHLGAIDLSCARAISML